MIASVLRLRGVVPTAMVGLFAAVTTLNALPWLWPGCAAAQVVGMAVPLALVGHLRGWRGELLVFSSAAASLAIAFHWAPPTIAAVLEGSQLSGWLFAIPILAWDAARVSLPIWLAARAGCGPRAAWLPVGLATVACEGVFPAIFPWRLGYSQVDWPLVIQSADLFGPAAPTFAVFAAAGVVTEMAFLVAACVGPRPAGVAAWPPPSAGGIAACAVVAANLGYGAWAIGRHRTADRPTARIVAVQVDPDDADGPDAMWEQSGDAQADLLIWPECSGGCYHTSLDSFADAGEVERLSRGERRGWRPLTDGRGAATAQLLFGAEVYDGRPERPTRLYRSAILVDPSGRRLGTYHKRWLMPFGEFVPAARALPGLARTFASGEPLTTGTEATVLDAGDGLRLGVLMCYEDMLPQAAASLARGGATLLVSLVNASSFPQRITLSQHRMLSQLRAVETRRSLVRCAATGETCVIDPSGGIVARIPLGGRGSLTADVPICAEPTLATRIGPLTPVTAAVATAALLMARGLGGGRGGRGGPRRCAPVAEGCGTISPSSETHA